MPLDIKFEKKNHIYSFFLEGGKLGEAESFVGKVGGGGASAGPISSPLDEALIAS